MPPILASLTSRSSDTDIGALQGVLTLYLVPVLHERGAWARITAIVVDERHRGGNVGERLIAIAEEVALSAGCIRIEATSATARVGAHRFYEKNGYAVLAQHFLKGLRRAEPEPS